MRAIHKYNSKTREGAGRIAQSMGYRYSIYDDKNMIALLFRAGIQMPNIDYTQASKQTYTEELPFETNPDLVADSTETIKL